MEQTSIKLEKIIYDKENRIGIFCTSDEQLSEKFKSMPGIKFCWSLNGWHIPYTQESFDAFNSLAFPCEVKIAGLQEFGLKNRPQTKDEALQLPNASQVALLKKFRNYLEQKRYSTTTIQQYESCVFNFLMWYKSKPIEQISINDIRAYNHDAFLKKDKSRSAQNIWISALKLFLEKLEISNIEISEVERPRARTYLPNILSIDEVKELISSYKNLKHKALILTVYSCGLRRSEV